VGSAMSLLLNYQIAKMSGGTFTLRIDDTDQSKCEKRYYRDLFYCMSYLNVKPHRIIRQADRAGNYSTFIKRLITSSEANGAKRFSFSHIQDHYSIEDLNYGKINRSMVDIHLPILQKGDGSFTYALASVADDVEMGITLIIRGNDHVNNTFIHFEMFKQAGHNIQFLHHPMILTDQRAKLSKREDKNDSISISPARVNRIRKYILSEAIICYLSKPDISKKECDQKKYTINPGVNNFCFDHTKLLCINGWCLRHSNARLVYQEIAKRYNIYNIRPIYAIGFLYIWKSRFDRLDELATSLVTHYRIGIRNKINFDEVDFLIRAFEAKSLNLAGKKRYEELRIELAMQIHSPKLRELLYLARLRRRI
jgi:glutamyl/glutaminyl-tRNA synthetase